MGLNYLSIPKLQGLRFRVQFSGAIFSDAIFGRDIQTRYSNSIFVRDIRTRYSTDSQTRFSDLIFILEFWTRISYFIPHIIMDVITGLPQSSQKIVPWLFPNFQHKFHSLEQQIPSINFFWQNLFISTPKSVNFLNRWCINVVLFKYVSTRYLEHHENCGYLGRVSEWLNITAFLGTAESEVHIVHLSPVILGEHLAKHETILDLTITVSLLSLEASSPPLFLKPMQIFVKNVHKNYSTYWNNHIWKHCRY